MVHTIHTLPTALPAFAEDLVRDGTVYVSSLETPLVLHTPTVTLAGPLLMDEELQDIVTLKFKKTHLDAFCAVEDALKTMAISHKAEWFKNEELTDETIAAAFKSFVDVDAKTLRVRVDDQLGVFGADKSPQDPPPQGTRVKAVLSLERATFTKSQFGAVWTLKHLRLVETEDTPAYLFDADETPEYAADITENPLDDQTILMAAHDFNDVDESL